MTIRIPRTLYDQVEKRVKASRGEFKTVDQYVEYVLGEMVKPEPESDLSEEDEKQIKENLKRLGYL